VSARGVREGQSAPSFYESGFGMISIAAFQRLDPSFAVASVRPAPGMAGQVPLDVLLDGRRAIRQARVVDLQPTRQSIGLNPLPRSIGIPS
jgi:hypothetical protein